MTKVSESDALQDDGRGYRTLVVDKSGGRTRLRDLLPWYAED